MDKHVWADDDEHTQNAPSPECVGAERAWELTAIQFCADAVAEVMIPYQRNDAAGDETEQPYNDEVHRRLVVVL